MLVSVSLFTDRFMSGWMHIGASNTGSHIGIGLNVFHSIVVHNTKIASSESFGHGFRYFSFGLNHVSTCFFCFGFHFLLQSNGHRTAFLCFSLGDVLVSVSLVYLQRSSDIAAYIDIGNINGKNFKGSTSIESFTQDEFRDGVWVFEY